MTTHAVLAADVGGTQMRAALVGPRGDVLLRRSAATPDHADVPAALIDLIKVVGAEHGHGTVSDAVVGLPGGVDYENGRLMWAPLLPEVWPDLLSRGELSARLGMPAHIANDADLAAVGEAAFGAGAGPPTSPTSRSRRASGQASSTAVEPRDVLLSEHRGHRGRPRTAAGVLRPSP